MNSEIKFFSSFDSYMTSELYVPLTIVHARHDGTKDVYERHEELGRGGFASVYRVTNKKTNQEFAMKIISKDKYDNDPNGKMLEKLMNEISLQKSLNHQNILKSYGSFKDAFNYYIVLEYCPGKSVKELLRKSENGRLTEDEAKRILRDVVMGVVYLHNHKVIHRDLKLENFMIGADGKIKIADFGISRRLSYADEKRFSICGTPQYLSPELLQTTNTGHSYEVDIWAIGVCAYTMLTGRQPFDAGVKKLTYEAIKSCNYQFPSTIPLSAAAKDFIQVVLKINPKKRPNAIDLANHKFLCSFGPSSPPKPKSIPLPPTKFNTPLIHKNPGLNPSPALMNNNLLPCRPRHMYVKESMPRYQFNLD